MTRKVRLYKYTCDECGWEAFRTEILPVDMCSKCGNTNLPIISTETKEFEFSAEVKKAAAYVKRLLEGEDPLDIDSDGKPIVPVNFNMVGTYCWIEKEDLVANKILKHKPIVY